MVLVMLTDAPFWDALMFDGIDDVNVEAVTAVFGTVEVVAKAGRGRSVRTAAASRADHCDYLRKPAFALQPFRPGRPPMACRVSKISRTPLSLAKSE
ncbi:hypothetical protein NKH18_35370 [Streptomyces sp. M10(2022)]